MTKITGYIVSFRQYLQTEKGAHDVADYLKAIAIIGALILLAMAGADTCGRVLL